MIFTEVLSMHILMWSGSIIQLYRAPAVNATGIFLYKNKIKQLFFFWQAFALMVLVAPFYFFMTYL